MMRNILRALEGVLIAAAVVLLFLFVFTRGGIVS